MYHSTDNHLFTSTDMEYRTMNITGGKILAPIENGSGDLDVPYGITELTHTGTFKNCTFSSIRIPSSVKEIRSDFFEGLTTIKTIYYDSTLEDWLKIKFKGLLNNPYTLYIDGEIAENIEIPDTITSIPNHCFYYCSSLRTVKFHHKVTGIGESAFNKSGLSGKIKLHEGIVKIDKYAFLNSKIVGINIPSSLVTIDNYAFAHCTELESIEVDENNSKYQSIEGVLFNKKGNAIEFFPPAHKDFYLGKEVNYICQCAFSGKMRGQKVYFKTVEPIGFIYDRFFKCSNIKFMVPQGKKSIFLKYGEISEDCVECYFDIESAILNGNSIEEISIYNNPYRILGAFSNSPLNEIARNCNDILGNSKENQSINRVDNLINNPMSECNRDALTIAKAQLDLSTPQEKVKHALFWFAKENDASSNYSSIINNAIRHYISKEYYKAIELTSQILEKDDLRTSFCQSTCGPDIIFSKQELYKIYIKELLRVLKPTALLTIFETFSQESQLVALEVIYNETKNKIDSLTSIAEKYTSYNLTELKDLGNELKATALELEEAVTMLFGTDDEITTDNADKLCYAMINCAIAITNKSELINRPDLYNAYQLVWKSLEFNSISQKCKDYRQNHFSKVSDKLQLCPPNEDAIPIYQKFYKIVDSINNVDALPIQQLLEYTKTAGEILMQIKTALPENDLRLNTLSSRIVEPISEKAITYAHKLGNADSKVYLECAHIFMLLNEFKRSMNEECEKRFKQCYTEIIDLCIKNDLPYFIYIVPFSFTATSQEFSDWQNSSSISGAEYYKEKYKSPHFKEVHKKIEYLKKSRNKRAWIIIPIVIAIILLIVGLATA